MIGFGSFDLVGITVRAVDAIRTTIRWTFLDGVWWLFAWGGMLRYLVFSLFCGFIGRNHVRKDRLLSMIRNKRKKNSRKRFL